MQEVYLHYLYSKNWFGNQFRTIDDRLVIIKSPGVLNQNAGPDFLNAELEYDGKLWFGHVEFHVRSSDWYQHGHQDDPFYDNVVMHFVYEADQNITIKGSRLPTIELKDKIDDIHYAHYLKFKSTKTWVSCAHMVKTLPQFVITKQKEKALQERLLRKSHSLLNELTAYHGDRRKVLLFHMARVFGGKVNGDAFVELVSRVKDSHIAKLDYDQEKIEAYLFGLSGLLSQDDLPDKYSKGLWENYNYQERLFALTPMSKLEWRFSRMRPSGFPTIRIALFAALLASNLDVMILKTPHAVFEQMKPLSKYWQKHYHFGKRSKQNRSGSSEGFKDLITINAYAVYKYAIGILEDDSNAVESSVELLRNIRPEKNQLIRKWQNLGVEANHAADSQGLLELYNSYCQNKKCLSCKIGQTILDKN